MRGEDAKVWKGAPGWGSINREREGGKQTEHSRGRNRRQMGELSEGRK